MRYHYEKPNIFTSIYGTIHNCNHPIYSSCTLFEIGERGLAVIQQRYEKETKATYWNEIDVWLNDQIFLHPKFKEFFDDRAGPAVDGLYPTVTVRQVMWALKMKPIPRERWETCFDRRII